MIRTRLPVDRNSTRTFSARAVVASGDERDRLYGQVAGGDYEKNTDRVFPVIVLDGVPAPD